MTMVAIAILLFQLDAQSLRAGHFEIPDKSQGGIDGYPFDPTMNIHDSRGPLRNLAGVGWSDSPDFAFGAQG
jgi:hypothetical protein